MESRYDLREALTYINPAEATYNEWLATGMALKDAGYPVSELQGKRCPSHGGHACSGGTFQGLADCAASNCGRREQHGP